MQVMSGWSPHRNGCAGANALKEGRESQTSYELLSNMRQPNMKTRGGIERQ
jgi:hypothetical protein